MPELVAYYSFKQGAKLSRSEIAQALRGRLPAYMVPAFLEELPFIPMLISNKADHKKLPKPKGPRCQGGTNLVAAKSESERILARALAEVLKVERVSVEDHFFNDLGAHSLLMARFCAEDAQESGDVERFDARHLPEPDHRQAGGSSRRRGQRKHRRGQAGAGPRSLRTFPITDAARFSFCSMPATACSLLRVAAIGLDWTYRDIRQPARPLSARHRRAAATFAVLTALPIAAKWLLIGTWKARAIPIWSLRYFRFWVVKTLMRTAPVAAFPGSPLYNLYLRAARRQDRPRRRHPLPLRAGLRPICSRSATTRSCARTPSCSAIARSSNFIEIGPIDIGSDAFVGEASVLDIDTAMGDGAQLGHASSLQSGQRVPDGKRYHGSPAVETTSDYCPIERHGSAPRCGARSMRRCSSSASSGSRRRSPMLVLNYWYDVFAHFTGDHVGRLPRDDLGVRCR